MSIELNCGPINVIAEKMNAVVIPYRGKVMNDETTVHEAFSRHEANEIDMPDEDELLYEVRTPDCGEKLLFQLVADRSGPVILLKPKGLKGYYYLPVSDLLLCCGYAS